MPDENMNTKRKIPGMFSFIAVIMLFVLASYLFSGMDAQLNSISFNEFTQEYRADKIKEINISSDGMTIKGIKSDGTTFTTVAAPERLAQFLNEEGNDVVIERYSPRSDFSIWT
ncbi:MAG TPA: hypothetical protein DHM90_03095, partial [Clostridiaceae bacterium]|nr:hypothetical protein [Clostridiaceae bacterium]